MGANTAGQIGSVMAGGVVLALTLTGILATYIPAKRVTRIDPAVALQPG